VLIVDACHLNADIVNLQKNVLIVLGMSVAVGNQLINFIGKYQRHMVFLKISSIFRNRNFWKLIVITYFAIPSPINIVEMIVFSLYDDLSCNDVWCLVTSNPDLLSIHAVFAMLSFALLIKTIRVQN
jgi:hypothetical protein